MTTSGTGTATDLKVATLKVGTLQFDWENNADRLALTNVRAAYGLDLPYLKDTDGDGFPDVIDPAPRQPGYRDGVK